MNTKAVVVKDIGRHTHEHEGSCPTKPFGQLQLKPRLWWAICDAVGCLEIGKYLRRVGADRTILYRNLDRTYMMDFDDMAKRHHAMMTESAELERYKRNDEGTYLVVGRVCGDPQVCW